MTKYYVCLFVVVSYLQANAQSDSTQILALDSGILQNQKTILDNLSTLSEMDENDGATNTSSNAVPLLTSNRDPFINAANFNFSFARFKIRGYPIQSNRIWINGLPMLSLSDNSPPFALWSGLNEIFRPDETAIHLQNSKFSFGGIGIGTAYKTWQNTNKKRTTIAYANANRDYRHRLTFSHSTGYNNSGWALQLAGSLRYSDEGYVPGTYYKTFGYFAGISKRMGRNQEWHLVLFGNNANRGTQKAATAETFELTGSNYYNAAWGWQNGQKRNANIAKQHQPVLILSHKITLNEKSELLSAIGYSTGDRKYSALDWNGAPDPRPDYYRYLPSYYVTSNPNQYQTLQDYYKSDPEKLQIDWQKLYDINRNSSDSLRSRYIVGNRITHLKMFHLASTYNVQSNQHIHITAGIQLQWQQNRNYQQVEDLLGGKYWLNVNQFAQRDFPYDDNAIQYDLNQPNRHIKEKENYGYDYSLQALRLIEWGQLTLSYNHWETFIATELGYTQMQRIGHVRNGLYPAQSLGESAMQQFAFANIKAGMTYSINGHHYAMLHLAHLQQPPGVEDIYISARTRDYTLSHLQSENILSADLSYILRYAPFRMRINGFATQFSNGIESQNYYDDHYQSFVNYALSNIQKRHYGVELGLDAAMNSYLNITSAVSIGKYLYSNRPDIVVTSDNTANILSKQTIFWKNFHVPGTPQKVYNMGLNYHSPKYLFLSLNANYVSDSWMGMNPLRRTISATDNINAQQNPALWAEIIGQQRLKPAFTLDFFGSKSMRVGRGNNFKIIVLSIGVNNLADKKDIQATGFEQLRYDIDKQNAQQFPPKYYYAIGRNYFANISFKF